MFIRLVFWFIYDCGKAKPKTKTETKTKIKPKAKIKTRNLYIVSICLVCLIRISPEQFRTVFRELHVARITHDLSL